ncbi:hypothetical protein HNR77_003262 [Paenibacillus sp. JGP012]|uniref:DUF3883 domain-containing protein n=1 Tax=unclassified Paenibacillus TaxID=185978 RepID=UPI0015C63598|nr:MULTISPECIES: DUF3883 domain-containing protein [unclassified Paenibacillus]MBB6022166.1 hypothetical protein [Paenibacillus sp. JGP012]QLG36922.1 DUF3883 domain-containing protein [Paenibacillus sp. E222]
MLDNHKLALIVAYFLSKYNEIALENLGYSNFTAAFEDIGFKLSVKPNTIKNMRDEFDPFHPNNRRGWYQRELRPSRLEVLEKYEELSESALLGIVKDILSYSTLNRTTELDKNIQVYIDTIQEDDETKHATRKFSTRGITGKRAEEFFYESFLKNKIDGFGGGLKDRRNDGCGFDFELDSSLPFVFEVKGLSAIIGGVVFTDKEWIVAKELGERYILVLVSNLDGIPNIKLIQNPYEKLVAKKNVYTTISINWAISKEQL